ncbi:MOSC domain-containing protein [Streptomyces sp. NPDC006235]|uniref:MOSC domain-containing protein n=1 Tax=Streptomyces sp. NPDC006235 TaxID=3156736 RepID=UPI0033A67BE8
MAKVISINTGKCVESAWATRRGRSAIEKLAISSSVAVTKLGIEGDEQAADFHGGVLQAVYAYAREDLDWWSGQLARPLRNGMFGENIDLVGFDVSGAVLAEQWRVGEVLLEVMAPRMACGTFGAWMGEKGWAKRFNAARRPGAYLRVLEEGRLAPGDPVEIVWRPAKRVTVAEAVGAILDDQDVLRRIVDMADDTPGWDRAAMMFHVSNRTRSAVGERKGDPAPAPVPAVEEADARRLR